MISRVSFITTSLTRRPISSCRRPNVLPCLYRTYASGTDNLPRVAQPSVWHSIIPKFLRTWEKSKNLPKAPKSKEWNPATFYIVIFLLIGSNAIQMIALRNDLITFSRRADAKIGLLKEVIERVQRGEDVDVEGLLGTGNPDKEKEWEEVLQEIEEEDRIWKTKEEKAAKRASRSGIEHNSNPNSASSKAAASSNEKVSADQPLKDDLKIAQQETERPPAGFY